MPEPPIPAMHLDGQFLVDPALDLTLYADDLTQPDFDALLELYRAVCPADRRSALEARGEPVLPAVPGRPPRQSRLAGDEQVPAAGGGRVAGRVPPLGWPP